MYTPSTPVPYAVKDKRARLGMMVWKWANLCIYNFLQIGMNIYF